MKKFTKMLALGMAAALVFGMTVSAAGSMNTGDVGAVDLVNDAINSAPVQDANGNTVELKVEATDLPETVYNETFGTDYKAAVDKAINSETVSPKIDEVFSNAFPGVSTDRMELYSDIVEVNVDGEIPAGGLYVPVLKAVENSAYVVAHWNGTAWEVLQTKVENGVVYALFPEGFSPVSVTIVTVGEEKPDNGNGNGDNNNDDTSSSTNDNAASASPKTGETVPVAGILAVICLAGVAVCAKKARYNR